MENDIQNTFNQYIEIFFKRKKLFFIPFCAVFAMVLGSYPFLRRTYSASALVLIEDNRIINPLIEGLAVKPSAEKKLKTLSAQIMSWANMVQLTKQVGMLNQVEDQKGLDRLIATMKDRIEIRLVTEDMIRISYEDQDRVMAMRVANALAENLSSKNKTDKEVESANAIQFIEQQLRTYKDKLQNSEKTFFLNKVNSDLEEALKRRSLIRDQMGQMEKTIVMEVIKEENPVVTALRRELVQSESLMKQMLLNSKENSPMVKEIRDRIDSIRRRISLEEESRTSSETSASNPAYQDINRQLKELELNISSLQQRKNDLQSGKLQTKNVSEQELLAMERDKKVNEDIYQSLLMRLENAHISQKLGAEGGGGSFKVIDPARLPLKPSSPKPVKTIGAGFVLAVLCGVGLIFIREYFDTSFRGVDDAKAALKIPMLAYQPKIVTDASQLEKPLIPWEMLETNGHGKASLLNAVLRKWKRQARVPLTYVAKTGKNRSISPYIVAYHDPGSMPAEQYRLFRTHFLYNHQKQPVQTLLITSSVEGEGKTTVSINFAVSMASELDRNVLLMDCDLRRGSVAETLGMKAGKGLSDYLNGKCSMEDLLDEDCRIDRLTVIPSGGVAENPTKLLGTDKMKKLIDALRTRFDFIVLDAPPVLNLADVPVMTSYSDGIVLVVQAGATRRELVQAAQSVLDQTERANMVGYVLTKVEQYVPNYLYQYIKGAY